MKRSLVGWVAAVVLAVGGAAFAYLFWFAGGSGEATAELTTPELSVTTIVSSGREGPPTTRPANDTTSAGVSARSFVIDQTRSTARFEIDEVLNGSPKHVVGSTDQVAGQFVVVAGDLSRVEFSEIIVNARTLRTDSERRDRAMRGPIILDTGNDEHELLTFVVTSIDGLNGDSGVGVSFDFTITGDLTIKGITRAVTFDVGASMIDESTIEGTAAATITRDMYEIGIPSVPSVADVTNEILIALDFVAVAA